MQSIQCNAEVSELDNVLIIGNIHTLNIKILWEGHWLSRMNNPTTGTENYVFMLNVLIAYAITKS